MTTIPERLLALPAQWAKNAKTTLDRPPVPGVAYRNPEAGAEDLESGQAYDRVYDSARHNQVAYLTTGLLRTLEQYGLPPWSRLTDYPEQAVCLGLDGVIYQAAQASGPGTAAGPRQPGREEAAGYWGNYLATLRTEKYELCEFYYFRRPTLQPGFQPAQGGLLANAAALYPEAWAYLQTQAGQALCTTESQWQAMTRATWATLADGTTVGWNGIGGAPFYAPDLETGALRLPDLRGMYAEAAGFDALGVGGSHGDAVRNISGSFSFYGSANINQVRLGVATATGAYVAAETQGGGITSGYADNPNSIGRDLKMNSSLVTPTANKNAPRAWGALACVYLGAPR